MMRPPDNQQPPADVGLEEQQLPDGKKYTVGAIKRAFSESKFEASLAQVLFQAWWEELLAETPAGDVPFQTARGGMDKCFRIAEEFRRKVNIVEFDKREKYDKEEREKYQRGGKTLLHLPDASLVQPLVPGGYIPGLSE